MEHLQFRRSINLQLHRINWRLVARISLSLVLYWIFLLLDDVIIDLYTYHFDPASWRQRIEDVRASVEGGLVFSFEIGYSAFEIIVFPCVVWLLILRKDINIIYYFIILAISSGLYWKYIDNGFYMYVSQYLYAALGLEISI